MVRANRSSATDTPVFWTHEDDWKGAPDGDMTLEFEGYTWRVKKDLVVAQFPWIRAAMARTKPGYPVVIRPGISKVIHPRQFAALLQFIHTNELPSTIWEDHPSFYTFTQTYFLAERLGMHRLKLAMVKSVDNLARHVLSMPDANNCHSSHCPLIKAEEDADRRDSERRHLASFLDAVLLVEEKPWSAKMVKAMYDAGDRLKIRLRRLPEFGVFVERSAVGRSFARAIGMHRL